MSSVLLDATCVFVFDSFFYILSSRSKELCCYIHINAAYRHGDATTILNADKSFDVPSCKIEREVLFSSPGTRACRLNLHQYKELHKVGRKKIIKWPFTMVQHQDEWMKESVAILFFCSISIFGILLVSSQVQRRKLRLVDLSWLVKWVNGNSIEAETRSSFGQWSVFYKTLQFKYNTTWCVGYRRIPNVHDIIQCSSVIAG